MQDMDKEKLLLVLALILIGTNIVTLIRYAELNRKYEQTLERQAEKGLSGLEESVRKTFQ